MNFYIETITDQGVKRPSNQDRLYAQKFETEAGTYAFAVLCDGMGGLQHGEVASEALVSAFSAWAVQRFSELRVPLQDHTLREEWTRIIRDEHQRLQAYGEANQCRLGTTVTALLLSQERFFILNIGDTRAYELLETVRQLTVDHTVVADEVNRGNLTQQQAEEAPMRGMLTRCVGTGEHAYPDMFFGSTKRGAVYLLCSDGFRHYTTGEEMLSYLTPDASAPSQSIQHGEEMLVELVKSRGEKDNISAVAIYAGS